MELKTYFLGLSAPERDGFAKRCDCARGHLQNVMYGFRPCSAELAAAIERESGGKVTRRELRPKDWKLVWPELDRRKEARA